MDIHDCEICPCSTPGTTHCPCLHRSTPESGHLIDPWPLWAVEGEDDEGNPVEGVEEMYLQEVLSPDDGTVWVTRDFAPIVMFRKELVDLESKPPTGWASQHRPGKWNTLSEAPRAVPTQARFDVDLVKALAAIPRIKIMPLGTARDAQPIAHGIVRGEELIGYIAARLKGGEHLPEALQVPDRRISTSPAGGEG